MSGDQDGGAPIDTGVGRFELRTGGVIYSTVAFGSTLDQDSAREAAATAEALASGEPVAINADAREPGFADRKSRNVLADAVRYLAEQYARQTEGGRPFRIFTSENEAVEWANEQLNGFRSGE